MSDPCIQAFNKRFQIGINASPDLWRGWKECWNSRPTAQADEQPHGQAGGVSVPNRPELADEIARRVPGLGATSRKKLANLFHKLLTHANRDQSGKDGQELLKELAEASNDVNDNLLKIGTGSNWEKVWTRWRRATEAALVEVKHE